MAYEGLTFMMRKPASITFFFFNDTATTEIYTLSLHDALPISCRTDRPDAFRGMEGASVSSAVVPRRDRSEEHTSELQSQSNLVCRLLLEKKKNSRKHASNLRPASRSRAQLMHYYQQRTR